MAEALTGGYQLGFLVGAALVVVAIAIAVLVLQPEKRAVGQVADDPVETQAA